MNLPTLCALAFVTAAAMAACGEDDAQDVPCSCEAQAQCPESTVALPIEHVREDDEEGWWADEYAKGTAGVTNGTVEILYRAAGVDHRVVYVIHPAFPADVADLPCSDWAN